MNPAVEKNKQLILDAERYLWKHPETGYREWNTTAYLSGLYERLGYEVHLAGDIPGFYAVYDTGKPGPTVLVFGEMDALLCPTHEEADPETGAVHICGHHCQSAALLGLAAALKEPGVADGMCGKIKLCAVPAEETIENGFREELYQKGVIRHFGGKMEFLSRGYFDDCDLGFMMHTSTRSDGKFHSNTGSNGFLMKNVIFKGKSAHAGSGGPMGINALYAANVAMTAANALRETFRDEDHVRFHPIIAEGGAAVNAIPARVRMESFVRGATLDVIMDANRKINRAMAGAAVSMGASLEIHDRPGDSPYRNDPVMLELFEEAIRGVVGEDGYLRNPLWAGGSSDMGDMAQVMPIIQPYAPGAVGKSHGTDFYVTDPYTACVKCAEVYLAFMHALLDGDAAGAYKVLRESEVPYPDRKEFLKKVEELRRDKEAVLYNEDGTVTLDF